MRSGWSGCSTDAVRTHLVLSVALLVSGVMAAGAGLVVALGYVEQLGPFNEAILGAMGGGMIVAGLRRWRKHRSSGSGHKRGTRQRGTSATSHQ